MSKQSPEPENWGVEAILTHDWDEVGAIRYKIRWAPTAEESFPPQWVTFAHIYMEGEENDLLVDYHLKHGLPPPADGPPLRPTFETKVQTPIAEGDLGQLVSALRSLVPAITSIQQAVTRPSLQTGPVRTPRRVQESAPEESPDDADSDDSAAAAWAQVMGTSAPRSSRQRGSRGRGRRRRRKAAATSAKADAIDNIRTVATETFTEGSSGPPPTRARDLLAGWLDEWVLADNAAESLLHMALPYLGDVLDMLVEEVDPDSDALLLLRLLLTAMHRAVMENDAEVYHIWMQAAPQTGARDVRAHFQAACFTAEEVARRKKLGTTWASARPHARSHRRPLARPVQAGRAHTKTTPKGVHTHGPAASPSKKKNSAGRPAGQRK